MRVRVLFFGMLRDLVGHSEQELELPDRACLETVFDYYACQFPLLRDMSSSIVLAHNQQFAARDDMLADGDEVALMPPVSGGVDNNASTSGNREQAPVHKWLACAQDKRGFYGLTRQVINAEHLQQLTTASHVGALLTFEGVVRDNSSGRRTLHLDYDCYIPLALQTMQQLGRDILETNRIQAISMAHRLGRLQVGETSVVIVVSSVHRQTAYEANLEAINRLKKTVPVWKKEYFDDGEIWVEGEWDESLRRS